MGYAADAAVNQFNPGRNDAKELQLVPHGQSGE
jgi:hypothetical protein